MKKRKILIGPLNWGLGHASRLIPVIKHFERRGSEVIIAANEQISSFLMDEFPEIRIIQIKSTEIKYTKNSFLMPKLFAQAPALLKDLLNDKKWIRDFIEKEKPDLIISDNRFGFSVKDVKSVYITHQINVILPVYMKLFQPFLRYLHRKIINNYDLCLIPDYKQNGLSGILSHNDKGFNFKHHYIGMLSGFSETEAKPASEYPDVLIVISGPEPQRSIFKNIMLNIFSCDNRKVWIISGEPDKNYDNKNGNIRIINHLERSKLKYLMLKSPVLIMRSGYTSLMDLKSINRKAILIPTPGQTEQEYLANYFKKEFNFFKLKQKDINSSRQFKQEDCQIWDFNTRHDFSKLNTIPDLN